MRHLMVAGAYVLCIAVFMGVLGGSMLLLQNYFGVPPNAATIASGLFTIFIIVAIASYVIEKH